jgi:hypothetical protein
MFYVKLLKNESFFVRLNTVCYAKKRWRKERNEFSENTSMDGKMRMFTLDSDIFNVSSNSFEG